MSEAEYRRNRAIVYDIYEIPIEARGVTHNMHHQIGKSEARRVMGWDFDVDQVSNLTPLLRKSHEWLHQMIDTREPRPRKRFKKRK